MLKDNPLIFLTVTFLTAWSASYNAMSQTERTQPQLSAIIDSLEEQDQKWRHLWTLVHNHQSTGSLTEGEILLNLRQTDSLNFFTLKKIIGEIGYPAIAEVGSTSSKNFWLLVQHQDRHPEFQGRVLKLMKVAVDAGQAYAEDYAYLLDRVLINTGQLQVYGTQMVLDSTKTSFKPKPVSDMVNLNARRKYVGLPSIEIYIQEMNERYHEFLTGDK